MTSTFPPRSQDNFRIAIICALPLEASLVESVLDVCWEDQGRQYGKVAGDKNAYTTGMIGGHNVVLTYMPGMGSTSAAAVVASLCMTFRAIELTFVVGICGAVPFHVTTREEIVLGDCIIGTAVFQYDFGRRYPSGFVQKNGVEDTLRRASPDIRAMVTKLTAPLGRQRLSRQLGRHLEALQRKNFEVRYPGAAKDRLYEPSYVHRHRSSHEYCEKCLKHIGTCVKDCNELDCDSAHLVTRRRLTKQTTTEQVEGAKESPRLHLGRFGSANTVMKSGEDRDRLAAAGQIVAFEMEGAGIWDYCPTVVIKAVCDYADSHKNKEWQTYAAASAASCTKAFLEEWTTASQPATYDQSPANPTAYSDESSRSSNGAPVPIWHVPFHRKAGFTGRTEELQRIKGNFLQKNSNRRTSIVGLGGMGKSRLALELAHTVQTDEDPCSVFWAQATSQSSFEQDIRDIGAKLDIAGIYDDEVDAKALVKQRLSSPNCGQWLLIVDNADDEGLWAKQSGSDHPTSLISCLPQVPHGFVVVTTRSRRVATCLSGGAIINLSAPSTGEGYQIFVNELEPEHKEVAADRSLAFTLLNKLSCLPLAIIQAASFLNMTRESIHTYLGLLNGPESEVVDLLSEDFGDHSRYSDAKNPIATTWLVSFDHIREHDPLAATYLSAMACLHNESIPQSLLPQTGSKIAAIRAMGTLTGYSFVTKQTRSATNKDLGDLYDMHGLVHLATRNWLKMQGSFEHHVEKLIDQLVRLFPPIEHQYRATWTIYRPHGEFLCLERVATSFMKRYELMQILGDCMQNEGKYDQAVSMHTEVLHRYEAELGPESDQTMIAHSYLGKALNRQGDWVAAETHLLRAYRGQRRRHGEEDLRTVASQARLAKTYHQQGRYREAEELDAHVLETRTRALGSEHADTLKSLFNLACTYHEQGRYQKAQKLLLQMSATATRVLGPEHPTTWKSLGNLALTYRKQGRYQETEKLLVQVLEKATRVQGPEHPDTLLVKANLANVLSIQGRTTEAVDLLSRCLDARTRVLGDQHPETRKSRKILERWQKRSSNLPYRQGQVKQKQWMSHR